MTLYSIKMRAAKNGQHVSGAEKILPENAAAETAAALTSRALHHSLGQADFINLKIEAVREEEILHLPALPVSSHPAATVQESLQIMSRLLRELGLPDPEQIVKLLQNAAPMRGAILFDAATCNRLEVDHERGVRVTYMDAAGQTDGSCCKNHFREALVLATKVAHAPGMLAEICISDDPDYVTGYLASLKHGYVRLAPLKNTGDAHGGRVFICDSRLAKPQAIIDFLEKQKVLVEHMPQTQAAVLKQENPAARLTNSLKQLQSQQLYRTMRTMDSQQSRHVTCNNKKMLMLSSNSYLDLAAHPLVKQAAANAALHWGAGSGGSRLTTGTLRLHRELEKALADFKHTESSLLFNTGYMANVGTIAALADRDSIIFSDEYNHASIIDGCRLSGAKIVVYRHNDMNDLRKKLQQHPCTHGLIVSDAVFSMDGDIVNLPQLTALGRQYGLLTMIDEAHATGVIGTTGQGTAEYYHYSCQPDITMGTLSKSLGSEGGFVCASQTIIDYLINKARSFIFSTAICPAAVAAAQKALSLLSATPQMVQKLQHNTRYFCQQLQAEGIAATSETAIIPIMIGDEEKALLIAEELYQKGILIPAIRYPTVARGQARLRAALMASHTEDDLQKAAVKISQAMQKYGCL